MDTSSIFKRLVQHIGEYLKSDVSHLRPDSRLANSIPGVDSLKFFELMVYLEGCFGVEFDESITSNINTMSEFVEYIQLLLSKKTEQA
jgi:acyl carrier protein